MPDPSSTRQVCVVSVLASCIFCSTYALLRARITFELCTYSLCTYSLVLLPQSTLNVEVVLFTVVYQHAVPVWLTIGT
jgi:hypothetical protein